MLACHSRVWASPWVQTLLEGLDEAALTTALLPLLGTLSRAEYAQAATPAATPAQPQP